MKLLFQYIKMKRRTLLIFVLFALIFLMSFLLYRIPFEAVVYPLILCCAAGAVVFTLGFLHFRRRHKALEEITDVRTSLLSDLPEPENITDEDYRRIIELLGSEAASLESEASVRYKSMTDYYTVWAHQIKTPIASMKLALQNEDSAVSRRLSSELFKVEQYVEMVLAFLRLGSPSTDYVFEEYDLDSVIRASVKKFAPDFIGKKLRFEYEGVDKTVVTDEKWFSFVLEQIISNALKYTKEGSIRIFMSDPDTLCVKDTGIGIAPEDIPRIFENGYTGINGRVDKSASGIGLYLCKRICGNLGVDISVFSVPGDGTQVSLRFIQDIADGE